MGGGLKWVLKGVANTKYFHTFANGRRQKFAILLLQTERGLLLCYHDIIQRVYEFYIELIGSKEPKLADFHADLWDPTKHILELENEGLALAFLLKKVNVALVSMKANTTPGL